MNEQLENRLYNFKFGQALDYLEGEDDTTRGVVEALAETFDDPGWFHGHMATIVMAACRSIGITFDDDERDEIMSTTGEDEEGKRFGSRYLGRFDSVASFPAALDDGGPLDDECWLYLTDNLGDRVFVYHASISSWVRTV